MPFPLPPDGHKITGASSRQLKLAPTHTRRHTHRFCRTLTNVCTYVRTSYWWQGPSLDQLHPAATLLLLLPNNLINGHPSDCMDNNVINP